MKPFSVGEIIAMQQMQASAMMDECEILRYSGTRDALNYLVPTWTGGTISMCGVEMYDGAERDGENRIAVEWDARLRLPFGTMLDLRDRIKITARFWNPSDDATIYDIISPPMIGVSGIVVKLKKMQPSL
jgi:hypothetical protein